MIADNYFNFGLGLRYRISVPYRPSMSARADVRSHAVSDLSGGPLLPGSLTPPDKLGSELGLHPAPHHPHHPHHAGGHPAQLAAAAAAAAAAGTHLMGVPGSGPLSVNTLSSMQAPPSPLPTPSPPVPYPMA